MYCLLQVIFLSFFISTRMILLKVSSVTQAPAAPRSAGGGPSCRGPPQPSTLAGELLIEYGGGPSMYFAGGPPQVSLRQCLKFLAVVGLCDQSLYLY